MEGFFEKNLERNPGRINEEIMEEIYEELSEKIDDTSPKQSRKGYLKECRKGGIPGEISDVANERIPEETESILGKGFLNESRGNP